MSARVAAWPVRLAAFGLLVLGLADLGRAPVLAQTRPDQRVRTEGDAAEEAARAAVEAERQRALESDGPPISFADVLANPDDLALNFRFARQKVAEGDLRAALSTIERILLLAPNRHDVRLFYAVLLFRLDAMAEAENQFRLVRDSQPPPDIQAEVDRYLAQIVARNRTTRFSASLGLGLDWNSNRDAMPRGKRQTVLDTPFGVNGGEDDVGRQMLGTLGVRHDLGHQDGHELLANATLYLSDQVEVVAQDLRAAQLEAGGTYKSWLADLTPTLTWQQIYLRNEGFLSSRGVKLRAERKLSGSVDVHAQVWSQYQDYQRTSTSTANAARTGHRNDGEIGLSWIVDPVHRLAFVVDHGRKDAKTDHEQYTSSGLGGSHTWLLGDGQFF